MSNTQFLETNETVIVTSGSAYIDIDVLACSLALSYLHKLCGEQSISCHTGKMNGTIPEPIKVEVNDLFEKKLPCSGRFKYALVDVSNPKYFEGFVEHEKIIEIYDHHFGFEKYWKDKLGKFVQINHVGSCATLIWEKYVALEKVHQLPESIAKLLYLAIVSNTLNLQAFVTTERDVDAKIGIEKLGFIKAELVTEYYSHIEHQLLNDFKNVLLNDVKLHDWEDEDCFIGQLEILDSDELIETYFLTGTATKYIQEKYSTNGQLWFVVISDINKGYNFIFTENRKTKRLIEKTFSFTFDGNFAKSDRLWMRKEFIRDMS